MISTQHLDSLIARFIHDNRQSIADELDNYASIYSAATAIGNDGKKHSHQYRIKRTDLNAFAQRIAQTAPRFDEAQSFDDIYSIVGSCRIPRIGALTIYDTAVRIGRLYNIEPREVYLQRGAKWGAMALGITRNKVSRQELVAINKNFSLLSPHEIESFLCLYHKDSQG